MNNYKKLTLALLSGIALSASAAWGGNPPLVLKLHNHTGHAISLNDQLVDSDRSQEFTLAGGEFMTGSINTDFSAAETYKVTNTDKVCCNNWLGVFGVLVEVTVNGHTTQICPTRWSIVPSIPLDVSFYPDDANSLAENVMLQPEDICDRSTHMDEDDNGDEYFDPSVNRPHTIHMGESLLHTDNTSK